MKNHYLTSLIITCFLSINSVVAQISFTASPTSGCPGLVVTFTNTTTDTNAYGYYFYFNDGTPVVTDTLVTSVTHVYSTAGDYYPSIDVYDSLGNWLGYYNTNINVSGAQNFWLPDSVCPGENVNPCGNGQADAWSWNFGDGYTTSGQPCPQHSYTTADTFTVTLIETYNACGLNDTVSNTIIVSNNIIPDGDFSYNTSMTCPGDNIGFNPYQYSGTHFWDFGDSTTSTLDYVNHTYALADSFTVTHIITNTCSKSDTVTNLIILSTNLPIPSWVNLNINTQPACPNDQINMNTASGFQNYLWDFGDGALDSSNVSNLYHNYSGFGTDTVSVTFYNGCGNDTTLYGTVTIDTTLGFPNDPWFEIDPNMNTICPGDNIGFNAPYGYPQYVWNYGDGTPMVSDNDSWTDHVYNNLGDYLVSVNITNNCGKDTTLTDSIFVSMSAGFNPWINFNVNPSAGCPGQVVNLNADGGFKKYKWDFGDGSTVFSSSNSYQNHLYADTGTYIASVTLTNNCNQDTILYKTITISNNVGFPTDPWFNVNVNYSPACPNTEMSFNAPNGYADYIWNFADSTPLLTGPISQVNHTYTDTGNYPLTVLITNQCGIDTTISATVTVINNAPVPQINFWVNPTNACPGEEINFSTQWGFAFYDYIFGDGTADTTNNYSWANHIYTQPGTYNFSIQVTNQCGIDTIFTGAIIVDTNIQMPSNAGLQINSTPACPGQEISMYAQGGGYQSYIWNFGDGSPQLIENQSGVNHQYYDTGTFAVSLTLTNFCGFDTTIIDSVVIGNNVGFTSDLNLNVNPLPVCPNDEVYFGTNSGYDLYTWNFGDSTSAIGSSWANHFYDTAGVYDVSVTIVNQCGIDTTITAQAVVDSATGIPFWVELQANPETGCPGDKISFYVSGSQFTSYSWDFGNGDTTITTGSDFYHTFDSVGNYTVYVTVVNGCGKTKTFNKTVSVSNNAPIGEVGIWAIPELACPGDEIQIFPQVDGTTINLWNFGDGNSDTTIGTVVKHSYTDTGSYTITLTAINACGNSGNTSMNIIIGDSIAPDLGSGDSWGMPSGSNVAGCPGDAVLFYFWGLGDNLWDFGDGYSDVATELLNVENGFSVTVIRHAYDSIGTYNVKLTRTNGCGFSVTDSMDVIVGGNLLVNGEMMIEEPAGFGGYTTCKPVKFVAFGGETYAWNFGDGSTLTSINPTVSHVYANPGNYSVSVKITNGCGNYVTQSQLITVFNAGGANVNVNIVTPVTCYNGGDGSAEATITGGQPPYVYEWSNPASQSASMAMNLSAGDYDVTVTDNLGCMGLGSVTINNPAPLALTVTGTSSQCNASTGTATVTVTGGGTSPYAYLWSNGSTVQTINSLMAGNYLTTVTDSNNCSGVISATISDSSGPVITIASVTHVTCNSGTNGAIDISATGGTTPYTFIWSNGASLEDLSGISSGSYTVTLTDANGCNSSSLATVNQPAKVTITFTSVGTACQTSNGTGTATPAGGTGSYTYLWDNNTNDQTTATATGLPAGAFFITVTDANGCTGMGNASISNTNSPTITSTVNNISCNGLNNGSITQSVTGGTTPYTYNWTGGAQTMNISTLAPQQYICIITDGSGCVSIKSYTVTQPALLTASASVVTTATCNNSDGSASVTTTGGTTPYTYSWTGGNTTSSTSGLVPGNYSVTVTDTKGCDTTSSVALIVAAAVQQLCVVTVDEVTTKNLIVWEKTSGLGTKGFVISKEILTNVYDSIGYVPFDSLSSFTDVGSDPKTKSNKYKLTAIDSCGNASVLSSAHKTMHLATNLGINGERNLILESYEGFSFGQYRIWRGVASNNIVLIDSIVSTATQYSDWDTLTGIDSLFYLIEVVSPSVCTSTLKLKTYNSSKSNTAAMAAPVITATPALISGNALEIFPNPYSGSTRISYALAAEGGVVTIEVYNVLGERVATVVNAEKQKGNYEYRFSASELGYQPGIYMVKMTVNGNTAVRKIVELR